MQPTVEAELTALKRTLAALKAEPDLPSVAVGDLSDALRALDRVEKTWSRVLPYLVFDNVAVGNLLLGLAPELTSELRVQIESAVPELQPEPDLSLFDVVAADSRNQELRALLSRVISDSTSGDANPGLRSRVIACLDRSLESRPW